MKRTKKSDKKNKKASCRRRIREQVGLFPSFIEFRICIWKTASCRRKRGYTSRIISFIISFKCVALTRYCTSSQGHHGTFDMKQIQKQPSINYGLHAWQNIKIKFTFRMCRQFLCEGWSHNQVSWLCDVPRLESIKKFWIISSSVERPEAKHPSEFFHCKNIFFQTNLKRHIVRFCHWRQKNAPAVQRLCHYQFLDTIKCLGKGPRTVLNIAKGTTDPGVDCFDQ